MRFYFDYQDLAHTFVDGQGEELPGLVAARDAAMRYLAKGIRDHSPSGLIEKISVHARTKDASILTVSATIEVVVGAMPSGKRSFLY
ncbi:hypothetical protein SAMN05216330_10972 [Bradyrhizobium sp. Ghvi]|uniref:DUF6894 family protein n=1 Tax=Bradyrhizobium sp. Ghvi TaxID=1855319 RepID=UPI0008E2FA6B|nr:hypothetical protein [Bradyrhizobium sp. Ghvi]SFP67046.1 hypothetical protein SAMN05216330_10972 [Bradyrhizobium sp. Ghvi]